MVTDIRAPRYLRIYRLLRQRIEQGQLGPGAQLPSQRELSRQFGVTPMTLRQALQLLEQDGLVESRHGSGTFVARRAPAYDLGSLRSFAQDMAAQGIEVSTQVLSARLLRGPVSVCGALGTPADEAMFRLERLRFVDGKPAVYQRSYLPASLGALLPRASLESASLYDLLRDRLHLQVVRASEALRPALLGANEARLLDEEPGAPVIVSERTTYTTGDRPVIFDQAYMPGSRLVITAERVVDNLDFRYEVLHGTTG